MDPDEVFIYHDGALWRAKRGDDIRDLAADTEEEAILEAAAAFNVPIDKVRHLWAS